MGVADMADKMWRVAWLAVGLCLAGASARAEEPVELRYRFQPQMKLVYRMLLDQTTEMSGGPAAGAPQKMGTHMDVDFYHKVLEPVGSGARMEIGFERVDAKVELGANKFPVPGLEEISKLRMGLEMTARGEMKNVTLQNAGDLSAQSKQIAEEMKKSIAQNSLVFPDQALRVGQSWSTDQKVPASLGGGGQELLMDVKSRYTLAALEQKDGKRVARIATRVNLALHGQTVQMGVPIQADLEGSGEGLAWFWIEQGRLLQSQAEFKIRGQISGDNQGQKSTTGLAIGMRVDMKLK
jgi:hypothetical protein